MPARPAFTLIELLVVVAIIAILAAIAVPNFLEAQTRARVSRVQSDQRAIADAAEMYFLDHNTYPMTATGSLERRAEGAGNDRWFMIHAYRTLSTPVAYLTQARVPDPFASRLVPGNQVSEDSQIYQFATGNAAQQLVPAVFLAENLDQSPAWPRSVYAIVSFGPGQEDHSDLAAYPFSVAIPYDPTNGAISDGDIFRTGPGNLVPRGWRGLPPIPPF